MSKKIYTNEKEIEKASLQLMRDLQRLADVYGLEDCSLAFKMRRHGNNFSAGVVGTLMTVEINDLLLSKFRTSNVESFELDTDTGERIRKLP